MTLKRLSPAIAALAIGLAANAAPAAIYPVPQQFNSNGTAFETSAATYRLVGASEADSAAVALLEKSLPMANDASIEITIGEAGDAAVASVSANIPEQAEGYYLTTAPGRVVIAGRDQTGTFYGVQSFLQLAAGKEVPAIDVTDWPDIPVRGVIEGFYGNPWSHADRMDMCEFFGKVKMNMFIYGPKSDPYHRGNWAEPYPADLAANISEMAREMAKNHITFIWAMHPSNAIQGDNMPRAKEKLQQMYDLGVRRFAIFFDDIEAESVDAQIAYMNYLNREFVKTHDDVGTLIVCPTQYNQAWSHGDYLSKTGSGLDPDIEIMWTGAGVVDMQQKTSAEWFAAQTGRKPFIWLNYPVNDYGGLPLLMAPYQPADTQTAACVTAYCSNPMEFYNASKVALYGIGDFAWNAVAYNPWENWERAMQLLVPSRPGAFRDFCYSNFLYPSSTHGLRVIYDETPVFKQLIDEHSAVTAENATAFADYFTAQADSASALLDITDNSLINEIREWILAYKLQNERGKLLSQLRTALDARNGTDFVEAYALYSELTDSAQNLRSRGIEPNTIRAFTPFCGTQFVEPFILSNINELVGEFVETGYEYPEGLFPAQNIPNGTYYIMYNGRYLSNGRGSQSDVTAVEPSFRNVADDINPNRQMWQIRYDMETGRYRIRSSFDERYINEKGAFGVNPYDHNWNTYAISSLNGKFAIQNGGTAGSQFWGVKNSKINGTDGNYRPAVFRFELVPTDGSALTDTVVELVDGATYVISDRQGRVLRRLASGNVLTFVERPENLPLSFKFKISVNQNGRYEIRSARADNAFVNELGQTSTGEFYADWNTYEIYEKNGFFSIRNAEKAGTDFWFVDSDVIGKRQMNPADAYTFQLENIDRSGIDEITADKPDENAIFDLQGRRVYNPGRGIYIINGKKIIL